MSRVLPILFNTDMVRAISENRKTVTRRVVKQDIWEDFVIEADKPIHYFNKKTDTLEEPDFRAPCHLGDILYVREAYCPNYFGFITQYGNRHGYKADFNSAILSSDIKEPKWRPSIHMPKKAARIWLKVIDVKAERLSDMTLDNLLEEGVTLRPEAFNDPDNAYMQARNEFITIWDSTIPKGQQDLYSWEADPWVWAIKFERCGKPEEN